MYRLWLTEILTQFPFQLLRLGQLTLLSFSWTHKDRWCRVNLRGQLHPTSSLAEAWLATMTKTLCECGWPLLVIFQSVKVQDTLCSLTRTNVGASFEHLCYLNFALLIATPCPKIFYRNTLMILLHCLCWQCNVDLLFELFDKNALIIKKDIGNYFGLPADSKLLPVMIHIKSNTHNCDFITV